MDSQERCADETAGSHNSETQGSEPPLSRLVTFLSVTFTCVLAAQLIKLKSEEKVACALD